MLEMASLGAKVMQPVSIQDARLNKIDIEVKSSFIKKPGTLITRKLNIKNNRIISGEANMTSYLQAWHTWQDNRLRVVMGTYYDKVRFKQNIGWQIYEMHLEHTSTDHRMVGKTFD